MSLQDRILGCFIGGAILVAVLFDRIRNLRAKD